MIPEAEQQIINNRSKQLDEFYELGKRDGWYKGYSAGYAKALEIFEKSLRLEFEEENDEFSQHSK